MSVITDMETRGKSNQHRYRVYIAVVLSCIVLIAAGLLTLYSTGFFKTGKLLSFYAKTNKLNKIIEYVDNNYKTLDEQDSITSAIDLLAGKNTDSTNKYIEELLLSNESKPEYLDSLLLSVIKEKSIVLPSVTQNIDLLDTYIRNNIYNNNAKDIITEIISQIADSGTQEGSECLTELLFFSPLNPGYLDNALLSALKINDTYLYTLFNDAERVVGFTEYLSLYPEKLAKAEYLLSRMLDSNNETLIKYLEGKFSEVGGGHTFKALIFQGFNKAGRKLTYSQRLSALTMPELELRLEPYNVEDFEKILLYMASSGNYEYKVPYKNPVSEIMNCYTAFNNMFYKYPEYFSFFNKLEHVYIHGYLNLKLVNKNLKDDNVKSMILDYLREADNILGQLKKDKRITDDMTQRDKAEVLYRWIAVNLQYDLSYSYEGYTGYGAAVNRKAVCQGYTALYNLLCRKSGIEVQGIPGIALASGADTLNHIWTLATLDGKKVYIDTTFSDPVPNQPNYVNMDYFAVNADLLSRTHQWDRDKYGSY